MLYVKKDLNRYMSLSQLSPESGRWGLGSIVKPAVPLSPGEQGASHAEAAPLLGWAEALHFMVFPRNPGPRCNHEEKHLANPRQGAPCKVPDQPSSGQ